MNRHHVSEANFASRNFANSLRRDVFLNRHFLNSTSVHVERMKPVLGPSGRSFSQVPVATPKNSLVDQRSWWREVPCPSTPQMFRSCRMSFCHHFWAHQFVLHSNLQGGHHMMAHTEKRTSENSRNFPHLQRSTYGS